MTILQAIQYLEDALGATQEFAALKQARQKLRETPGLEQMVSGFQKKQAKLYSSNVNPAHAEQMMGEINRDYEYLSAFPEARDYFGKIEQMNSLLNSIMSQAYNSLDSKL